MYFWDSRVPPKWHQTNAKQLSLRADSGGETRKSCGNQVANTHTWLNIPSGGGGVINHFSLMSAPFYSGTARRRNYLPSFSREVGHWQVGDVSCIYVSSSHAIATSFHDFSRCMLEKLSACLLR